MSREDKVQAKGSQKKMKIAIIHPDLGIGELPTVAILAVKCG